MALFYPPSQNGLQKSLGAALDEGETSSVTLNNVTGIQDKAGVFVVDRIDTGGSEKDSSVREYISFTGVSGNTLTGLARGLAGSTDQDHAIGAVVEFVPDVVLVDGIMDALDNAFTSAGAVDTTKVVTPAGTQTLTNKTLTSPVLNTGLSGTAFLDEDAMDSNSATKAASQQSIKAYVDSGTVTMTNKRLTKRVTTITSSATPTINTDNCDVVTITAQAAAITSMTSGLSGTPTNFQSLIIRIKDDGTGRAITWGTSFEAKGVALPTTTVANKLLTVGFLYDTVTSKWGCVASSNES